MDISDAVLAVIRQYRNQYDPERWWMYGDFDYICAVNGACDELIKLIKTNSRDPPLDVIESYHDLMLSYDATNKSAVLIFRASVDTAEQIVQILMKGE